MAPKGSPPGTTVDNSMVLDNWFWFRKDILGIIGPAINPAPGTIGTPILWVSHFELMGQSNIHEKEWDLG